MFVDCQCEMSVYLACNNGVYGQQAMHSLVNNPLITTLSSNRLLSGNKIFDKCTVKIFSSVLCCMDAFKFLDRSRVSFSSRLVKREEKQPFSKAQQNNRLLFSAVIRCDSTHTATLWDPAGLFASGPPSEQNRATPTRSGCARNLKMYQFYAESLRQSSA